MLKHLCLRNLLFIKNVELTFTSTSGFCVLTGETGAGKSLLIDALSLLSGARANRDKIGSNAQSAEIEATFDLENQTKVSVWLDHQGLIDNDNPHLLLARRVIHTNQQKSLNLINGRRVTLAQLGEVTGLLMDICGQHAYYSLRDNHNHQLLLDSYGHCHSRQVTHLHDKWQALDKQWQLAQSLKTAHHEKQYALQATLDDLSVIDFSTQRFNQMNDVLTKAAHIDDLAKSNQHALDLIEDEKRGVHQQIYLLVRQLDFMYRHDSNNALLQDNINISNDIIALIDTLTRNLRTYKDGLIIDSEESTTANHFISECYRLARKYGIREVSTLGDFIDKQKAQIISLPTDYDYQRLKQDSALAYEKFTNNCLALSKKRQQVAKVFSKTVNALLKRLSMPKALFSVKLSPQKKQSRTGAEKITFHIRTRDDDNTSNSDNISDIASGGELSRLALAIQIAAGQANTKPVIVFDEIDTGIGGATADVVGSLLQTLGQSQQILCVTHLAPVAAYASNHWLVSANPWSIKQLDANERVEEIARMHSGSKITPTARKHAQEMINHARQNYKRQKCNAQGKRVCTPCPPKLDVNQAPK